MLLSFALPGMAADTDATYADLAAVDASLVDEGTDTSAPLSYQAAIEALLKYSGMPEKQLGAYPDDWNAFAVSLGMISGSEDLASACTTAELKTMADAAKQLKAALEADKLQPLFMNGMAQPIFPYTTGAVEEGYSNADSDIIRYCVYVETNYDTDGDGKLDLVKALVQIPRAAMEGDYKAATIYEARPYITGCTPLYGHDDDVYGADGYDMQKLYSQPAARTAAGTATTEEAAAAAVSSDWYYYNPNEEMMDYEDLTWYDYYLVRGYAVVECGGLGTKGSEGFETCGSDLEIDAFKCVIEWLTGDRVAYTDKTSNIAVKADWSNGKVGMTGRSYAGTTQFGLATTGVKGLETIVPVAGISSWYEYTNSQGVYLRGSAAYTDSLAGYCAGRYLDEDDWNSILKDYGNYLGELESEQLALNGDYGDTWKIRDYTLNAENIKCPALIVHGLNDDNVRTKMFDQMYKAYEKAGVNVKLLLHQDGHLTPTYPAGNLQFYINGESYDSVLNRWFSHYLYGVDNGAESMAAVTAQSNSNPDVWNTYDSWNTASKIVLTASAEDETVSVSSDYSAARATRSNWRDVYTSGSTTASAMFVTELAKDTVIKGSVAVSFTASVDTDMKDPDGLMVSAMLVDMSDETFKTCSTEGSYVPKTTLKEGGAWMGGGVANFDLVKLNSTDVNYKVVARGWMDLCNPTAGYDSASATGKVDVTTGESHDYTVYLQPNLYSVPAGHKLALVLYTEEPTRTSRYDGTYTVKFDVSSVKAEIPVDSADSAAELTAALQDVVIPAPADVAEDAWYYDAVKYVVNKGLMQGTGDDTFEPDTVMTRAMFVTVLGRMDGVKTEDYTDVTFKDVESGSWYAPYVAWANANGIVTGFDADTFSPASVVTREQMAAILYRYAQYKQYDVSVGEDTNILSYDDAASVSEYAVAALQWTCGAGLIQGTSETTLSPAASANRAQVATIMMRFCESIVK